MGLYIYSTKSAYWKISKDNQEEIISIIQSAPALPERFYYLYNKIYPGSLDYGQLHYFLNRNKGYAECPCRLAGYKFSTLYNIHLTQLTFWLEEKVSPKECLNYYAAHMDFSNQINGILQASNYYFDKNIRDLSDYELIELIIILENPTLYNKNRKSDRLNKRVNDIMKSFISTLSAFPVSLSPDSLVEDCCGYPSFPGQPA